jgi:aspartate racemase
MHPAAVLLNIVDATLDEVTRRVPDAQRVGVLATTGAIVGGVYQAALAMRGIEAVVPCQASQNMVQDAIYNPRWGIKACSAPPTPNAKACVCDAATELVARGAEAVVLGCTELPLAFAGSEIAGVPVVDSTQCLARKAITCAGGRTRPAP